MKRHIETVVQRPSLVGEGAIWDSERKVLYWVDIIGQKLFAYDPATGENREIDTLQAVGTVVPRASGGLVVALHNGFASLDPDSGLLRPIADPERDIPANRFNDGKCDPAGRLWAGTMEFDGEPDRGALYCLDTDGTVDPQVRQRDHLQRHRVEPRRAHHVLHRHGPEQRTRVRLRRGDRRDRQRTGHRDQRGKRPLRRHDHGCGGHGVDRHLRRLRGAPLRPGERRNCSTPSSCR